MFARLAFVVPTNESGERVVNLIVFDSIIIAVHFRHGHSLNTTAADCACLLPPASNEQAIARPSTAVFCFFVG